MKNLDLISKRILVVSLSISSVLLCASLLIFAARPAKAQSSTISSRMDDGRRYDAIAGNSSSASGGNATSSRGYFLIWNTQTGTYKVVLNEVTSTLPNNIASENLSDKFW